jgi:dTDP-4-dehydrorhamnose reductase
LRETHRVHGCWRSRKVVVPGVDARPVDLLDAEAAQAAVAAARPDVILHTAALTDVDRCETDPASAFAHNVRAAEHVARIAADLGARLIHVSTDHLHDGRAPLRTETDPPAPVNVYARTKAEAEAVVARSCPGALVVRTNFFGWGPPGRRSFSDWILDGLERGTARTMFTDCWFTPLLANDVVHLSLALLSAGAAGVCNVAGRERVSKYEFALRLAAAFGYGTSNLQPVPMEAVALKATRPRELSLSSDRAAALLGRPLPDLDESLRRLRGLRDAGWPQRLAAAVAA